MSRKEQIYKNIASLEPIRKLLAEVKAAISEPSRISSDSAEMNEALAAASGIAVGSGIGLAALYYGGSVVGLSAAGITSALAFAGSLLGGGMAVGIAVLAAPAVLLGVGGHAYAANLNKRKLREKKEMLLQEVVAKHGAILKALHNSVEQNKDRIEYLTNLNALLQAAVRDLKSDLGHA